MKSSISAILVVCAVTIVGVVATINTSPTGVAQDAASSATQGVTADRVSGTITDIINVPGYTYVEVETTDGSVWAAAPGVSVLVGDTVSFTTGMPMKDFYSSSLQRRFEFIYFVDRFAVTGGLTPIDSEAAAVHGRTGGQVAALPAQGIRMAEGGITIAEIYARGEELRGETVRVRGQVVKFTPGVLNANWIRIQDGSIAEDLVITTDGNVSVNDILLVKGKLELGKNLGQGYVIPAIIENAEVSIE
ncbi:MAG: hypothetical protein OEM63_11230 [Gammaproteobacteria bacterium]|nr:hypothetical protein [Gammaproteobacteria bacterium]